MPPFLPHRVGEIEKDQDFLRSYGKTKRAGQISIFVCLFLAQLDLTIRWVCFKLAYQNPLKWTVDGLKISEITMWWVSPFVFDCVSHEKSSSDLKQYTYPSWFIWVPWVAFHPLVTWLKPSELSHEAWPFCEWWYTPIFTYPKLVSCKPALHPPSGQHGYEKSPSKKG